MLSRSHLWLRNRRRRAVCTRWMKLHKRRSTGRSSSQAELGAMPQDDADKMECGSVDGSVNGSVEGSVDPEAPKQLKQLPVNGEAKEKPKRQVTLLPSVFEGRPPVVLFSYTVACGAKQRPMERGVLADIDGPRMFYSHTDAVHEYNAVINILRQGGLYRVRADSQRWSLLWSNHPPPEVMRALRPMQRTNHFPGSWHLGRKDLIWKNIARMQRKFGREHYITPKCFVLPKACLAWDQARQRSPGALWIWKPCSASCGRGIKVLSSDMPAEEVKELNRKRGIVQRYIANPLLIDGYKFDLRVYVVVLSYDPLKVYICEEGLVRIATEKYSVSADTLDVRTMHLTNYSVNKSAAAFVQNKDGKERGGDAAEAKNEGDAPEVGAFKWSLRELRENFNERGLDYDAMFDGIKDVAIKTLLAVEAPMQEEFGKSLGSEEDGWAARGAAGAQAGNSCFEIYGFDVMIDSAMKPWLLEVNICPSLSSGSPLDKRIKTQLVADTFTLAGVRPPASMWRHRLPASPARKRDRDDLEDRDDAAKAATLLSKEVKAQRAARFAACEPLEAVALFEEAEWELVLDAHDEDMRSGGLTRCYPAPDCARYTHFFEETYANIVLRRWQEAGGGDLFARRDKDAGRFVPPWVPRQVCHSRT